jgi:hypothetical protein
MSQSKRMSVVVLSVVMGLAALTLFLTNTPAAHANPGIIYVDASAPGPAHDGSSWTTAYVTLQPALDIAIDGDELWVAKGVYPPTNIADRTATFQLKSGVALYGGFAATETLRSERNPTTNVTRLSGDLNGDDVGFTNNSENVYHVVTGATGATLDGFTITAGNANSASPNNSGGGMYNYWSSPALTDVTFSGNYAYYGGGGMYNFDNSNPMLTNVTFSGNTTDYLGGGMSNESSSSPTLANVTFISNTAYYGGGGMSNESSSSPILTNVAFISNTQVSGGGGGGMYNNNASHPTLTDVTFSGNSAGLYGGGMYNDYSHPTLANVTFISNTAFSGGGMYNQYSSNPTVTNVTFISNTVSSDGGGMCNTSNSNPALTNVTFSGNSASSSDGGGGMYNDYSHPTLTDVTFISNTAANGGGMYNDWSSSPTLTDVTFSGNSTGEYPDGRGGGMYNMHGSSPMLTNVTFNDNTASNGGSGGGMYNYISSSPTLTDVTFSGNTAATGGGGMINHSSSNPALENVTFINNTTDFRGGGMYNFDSHPMMTNVTFISNTATYYGGGGMYNYSSSPTVVNVTFSGNTAAYGNGGGGMYNEDNSNPTVTNVTFSGNTAFSGGGMYNQYSSNPTVTNVTFSDNSAQYGDGGGIYNQSSSPQIRNTIFWGNTATNGAQIYNDGSGTASVSDSVVEDGYAGGTNIIIADPILGTLGNYGGSTQTIPLGAGSSAIDAGNNTTCATTDQRGQPRDDLQCDIGAYELKLADGNTVSLTPGATMRTFGSTRIGLQVTGDNPGVVTVTKSITWTTAPTGHAILARWTITPTNPSYTVTLKLCWLADELNDQVPANLLFWRYSGGTWTSFTPNSIDVGAGCATLENVDKFSTWTLATEQPLAVILAAFTATRAGDHNTLAWETVSELRNLGFNVWRGTSAHAPDVKLNQYVIPSQAPGSTDGYAYSYDDFDLASGATYYYWLEDIDLNGTVTWHGPVSTMVDTPMAVTLHDLTATANASPGITGAMGAAFASLAALVVGRRRLKQTSEVFETSEV